MGRHSLPSRTAKRMQAKRKIKSGGRQGGARLKGAKRCPCAMMTLKRAIARGKSKEHDPSCEFYRAIIA